MKVECIWYPWINFCNLTNLSFLFFFYLESYFSTIKPTAKWYGFVGAFFFILKTDLWIMFFAWCYHSCSACICLSRLSRHGLNGRNLKMKQSAQYFIVFWTRNFSILIINFIVYATHISWIRWLLFSQKHFLK